MTRPEQVLALLQDYAPLPLTYDDLQDELGISRKNAQHLISVLAREGRVRRSGKGTQDVQLHLGEEQS